jgi:hypothetical protein
VVPPDADLFIEQNKEGYRLMAYSLDITMIQESCKTALTKIRAAI